MAMATSYNWLFQWDYTFYKWGFVMAITVFAIQNMFVRSIRHMQTHQDIGPVPLKAVRRSREVHLFFRLPSGRSTRRTGKSPCLINQMVLDLSLYIHSLSIYIYINWEIPSGNLFQRDVADVTKLPEAISQYFPWYSQYHLFNMKYPLNPYMSL